MGCDRTVNDSAPYRRVHRLTPLLRVWAVLAALITLMVFNFTTFLVDSLRDQHLTGAFVAQLAGGIFGGLAVLFAVSQLWWAHTGFRLREEDVELRRGVISTQVRAARYDRIQAVDVVEPFAPRIFGLASVRVEAAGGANSAIEIGYLPRAEAEQVRIELLRAIAQQGPDAEMSPEEALADPSEYVVAPIPVVRSLLGAGLRLTTVFTLAWSLIPVFTEATIAVVLPVLVGFIPQIWRQVDQSWRYQATLDSEVLNLSYGLANRRRQAVPLDRIHAIGISQPVLWRPFGWWSVTVNIAGYGSESNKQSGTSRLLPVGSYEQAVSLIDAISPLTREHITAPNWQLCSPKRARVPSPIDAGRQAVSFENGILATRHGMVSRKLEFIEVPHIQEVTYRQGPVQRMMRLAHVRLDLVPGTVRMKARDLDTGDAWALVQALRERDLPGLKG